MKSFTIEEPLIKDFMQHLFNYDTFIDFEVRGVLVRSFTTFEISGQKDGGYCTWDELRSYVRHIIGNTKPRAMKIVFARDNPEALHPNAAALFLNISYDNDITDKPDRIGKITCTTASSQKNFELNKSVDDIWDEWVTEFLPLKQR